MKIIFTRYGEWENGHLNERGLKTMTGVAEKLKPIVHNQTFRIICANIPRAIESAEILAKSLNASQFVESFSELYAAEEDGVLPDVEPAEKILKLVSENQQTVIAVISREYIEVLPNHILNSLGIKEVQKTSLDRGQILVLYYDTESISYLSK